MMPECATLEELGRLVAGWDGEAPECAMCVPTCQECCGEAHEPDLVEARIAALEIRISELERVLDLKASALARAGALEPRVRALELRMKELEDSVESYLASG